MTLDKLKVAARQHEQQDQWRAAIDLYREAIRSGENELGGTDPALYNRIGDLEQKDGALSAAVDAWTQSAARYAEQGFYNNAIAVCGKILRLDPEKVSVYLDLARFQARKRVIYDVRQNLTLYHEQMTRRSEAAAALEALNEFEQQFSSWTELRLVLDELLGREPAPPEPVKEDKPSVESGSNIETGRADNDLVFLDTGSDADLMLERASEPTEFDPNEQSVVVEHTILDDPPVPDTGNDVLAGLETTSFADVTTPDTTVEPVDDVIEFERTADEVGQPDAVSGLEVSEATVADDAESIVVEGLESAEFNVDVDPIEIDEQIEVSESTVPAPGAGDGIVFIDDSDDSPDTQSGADPSGKAESGQDSPGAIEIEQPGATKEPSDSDPLATRAEGHERLDQGDRAGAIAKLDEAFKGYVDGAEWSKAWQVATELIEAEPRAIDRHQGRVEIAAKLQDTERLTTSYFELGEALISEGSEEKAIAVFRRLLEIDETHAGARAALRRMAPDAAEEETEDGFIDLGAMVIDDVGPTSTRMRTETTTISEDEDETFKEALAEFKRALDQNLPIEDHQTHYDLGLAFKEMGLYEEAIGSFQKALRSPEGRLRTSEALGQCFYEQGRPAVAEAVLRAVEKGEEDDAEKIGVLYWLGRALEEQGKKNFALGYYERVMAVDVGFADASDRAIGLSK